jgi:hypothetical protein
MALPASILPLPLLKIAAGPAAVFWRYPSVWRCRVARTLHWAAQCALPRAAAVSDSTRELFA